jgi:ABC-type multidrug transport system ATPase subunit
LRDLAKRNKFIVIYCIHQPYTSMFNLFDKLLLLSGGKSHYFGPMSHVIEYYESIGVTIPQRANPAVFLLELVNIDFSRDITRTSHRMAELQSRLQTSPSAQRVRASTLAFEYGRACRRQRRSSSRGYHRRSFPASASSQKRGYKNDREDQLQASRAGT